MSKIQNTTKAAIAIPVSSKKEAEGLAKMALTGQRTLTHIESTKLLHEGADHMDVAFKRLDHNLAALVGAEIQVADHAKGLISRTKNLAGQLGDAMARIDKVVVHDFEPKLSQLERFVSAMQILDSLKKEGRLDDLISSLTLRK